ncbi:MAG: hypothetical protein K2L98_01460, partial [Bacilli bacterium]|nr:hypothetical protein [Bacilli bacterium]
MEKDISYAQYRDAVNSAVGEYINYLIDKSVFVDIYDNLLKGMKYPQITFTPNRASLESIRHNVINNTRDFLNGVNLDVKWLDKKTVDELRNKYAFDAHRYIMEAAHNGSIFDIPLIPSKTYFSYIDHHSGEEEDFKDVVFKRIALLLEEDGDILESTYFHELGHALISRNWYMITNPLFDEYV